ncbi:MAG: adenylate/guanylate cyclase domain-containing protein, partial [Myxococcota bacterium]
VHRAEAAIVALLLLFTWHTFAFGKLGLQYNALYPGMCLVITYLGVSLYEGLGIETRSRETRKAFEAYAPPEVVDMIVGSPEKLVLGGERRDISVLFSDIEGFTSLSEALSPEEVTRLLHSYLTPMTEIVFDHKGTLDKYIGDAIMAIFGAPLHNADHAERACCAALAMMAALDKLKDKAWYDRGWPDLQIRIGISSGPMAVGNMGTDMRFAYTAIGDGVNLASRLEALNKEYGTRVLISEFTRDRLKSVFSVREIDVVRVRGKQIPVRVYELRGEGVPSVEEARFISDFETGLKAFRSRAWEEAKVRFRTCLAQIHDDGPARVMLARCEREGQASGEALRRAAT